MDPTAAVVVYGVPGDAVDRDTRRARAGGVHQVEMCGSNTLMTNR